MGQGYVRTLRAFMRQCLNSINKRDDNSVLLVAGKNPGQSNLLSNKSKSQ